jgi:hypothetical protein
VQRIETIYKGEELIIEVADGARSIGIDSNYGMNGVEMIFHKGIFDEDTNSFVANILCERVNIKRNKLIDEMTK